MFLTERHYIPECALWHIPSVQSESGWIISETSARELQTERGRASLLAMFYRSAECQRWNNCIPEHALWHVLLLVSLEREKFVSRSNQLCFSDTGGCGGNARRQNKG